MNDTTWLWTNYENIFSKLQSLFTHKYTNTYCGFFMCHEIKNNKYIWETKNTLCKENIKLNL